ncbi:MAG: phenylalanine--tRNA ligase subunit beta [Aquificae bacterium]|nr:phenylalanine--tRNA ligase subunit beta [Aquificota bacterium]
MKVPYSWIKEFLDIEIPADKVAEKLNTTGIEAVSYKFGQYIPGLTTVKVLSVKKHPEKERLLITKVTDGKKEYQVITADQNIKEGQVVILAKTGAKLPNREIKPVTFGNIQSQGMFVSLQELGIEESSEGIFVLDEDTPIGIDASKLLGLGEEDIIEIEITPNRADVLSVKGLAREIGAIFDIKRKEKYPIVSIMQEIIPQIQLKTEKTYRYRGVIIKNIEVTQSPLNIRLRLIKAGQKPINNIVDATNYILLQEGQPLHAFDLDKIQGQIIVRQAKDGETITTLDREERKLKKTDIVIADEEKPIAIAGIIGGENTKVDQNTKNILLEAAVFDSISIRKTAKRLAVSTESSYRFERGVDIENLPNAQDKAVELILKTTQGKAVGEKDIYPKPYTPKLIHLREKTVLKVLGEVILKEESKEILERLEIPTEITDEGTVSTIPAFRKFDLEREIDLVEEVGRLKGFDNFAPSYPKLSLEGFKKSEEFKFEVQARDFLRANGLTEVVNYTFVGEQIYKTLGIEPPKIRIVNYLLKSQSIMRDNLAVSLIQTFQENIKYQNKDISIFEISSAFFPKHEEIRIGILVHGNIIKGYKYTQGENQFSTSVTWDFLKLKGLIESYIHSLGIFDILYKKTNIPYLHPFHSAQIDIQNQNIGYIGKIHPEKAQKLEIPENTYVAELKLRYIPRDLKEEPLKKGYLYTLYKQKDTVIFKELPKYPSVKRDLAFLVDENLELDKLIKALKESSKLIDKVELFDVYFVENGKKSIAFSVEFRASDRSLSDEEVNQEVENIIKQLQKSFKGLTLRV